MRRLARLGWSTMNASASNAGESDGAENAPAPRMVQIVGASVAGNILEWYDFFLYGTASALIFGRLFFPIDGDPILGTLAAFAALAVGFAARPFGGILFGHYGDRVGRKKALLATLILMGVATFIIGLLPTYETIGIAAPIALVVLRIAQGIAAGGEWGGGVLIISENAPAERRGFFSAWSQIGVGAGFILSAFAFYLVQQLPEQDFLDWGWRLPFLASILIFFVGAYIRRRLPETEDFEKAKASGRSEVMPVLAVLRRHPREILIATGLRVAENGGIYIFLTFALAYAQFRGIDTDMVLLAIMGAMAVELVSMVSFGALSDKIGRRPVYFLGAAGMLALAFPFFAMLDTGKPSLIFLALLLGNAVCHGAMVGTQPAFFTELFDADVRYSGLGIGHELANVFAGGLAPLVATALLAAFGVSWPISLYMMGMALITIVALLFAREPLAANFPNRSSRFASGH